MSIQRGGSIDRPCAILSRRGGRRSKVWTPKSVHIMKLIHRSQVPCLPCKDPRLGRSGRGLNWTHIQDSDSIIELGYYVVTEVNEPIKR